MPTSLLTCLFKNAIAPVSRNEDKARREFILNVLLFGTIILLSCGALLNTFNLIFTNPITHNAGSLSSLTIYALLLFFLALYVLSRKGLSELASYLLIIAFFTLAAYMGYRWGIDVPAQVVLYPLIIVMAGILVSTRFAFIVTLLTALVMGMTGSLQHAGLLATNQYWKNFQWTWSDVLMIILIYLIVATVSWLSNREIEKSLKRARRSEAKLKQERDTLEVRVEERTRDLRQAEMEKMSQAYHFVEFGRLAGGIFHDLTNPLAALSLNIDRIADAPGMRTALSDDVARAKRAAAHMQKLMESMRKHLAREGSREFFPAKETLNEVVQMVTSYASAHGVRLSVRASESLQLYGDPVAFTQVMTNLVSNAVQSYPTTSKDEKREVVVSLEQDETGARISVSDQGSGITAADLRHIFEPFFTTKSAAQGLGIGLSLAKRIVEKDFGGTLTVDSTVGKGSTFTVYLPIREP